MNLDSNITVKEVAVQMPQATRIFEKLKIDYCCGGNTPLVEACANAGVAVSDLEEMLAKDGNAFSGAAVETDFQAASLAELIDHILTNHHVFTKAEMLRLQALLTKVVDVHGENHPELHRVESTFHGLCRELNPHMFKEEQILFPYILELERAHTQKRPMPFAPFGTVNNPVRMMIMEHDTAGEILRQLRNLTTDYAAPADACISYQTLYSALQEFEADLHQHIHLENNILFPRAVAMEEAFAWK